MSNLSRAAEAACTHIGVKFRQVPCDGRFHQLDVVGKSSRNGAGRIRQFQDGMGGQVWNHITDETILFWADEDSTLTPQELEARKQRALQEREQAEKELAAARQKAAALAKRIVDRTKTPVNPLYWQRKQVAPTDTIGEIDLETLVKMIGYLPKVKGKAFSGNMVQVISVRDDTGITSIEIIDETGLKAGLSYGKKKGCFWASCKLPETDSPSHTFIIGEGVATVLSSITAMPGCIGIAALSCGNLAAVAKYISNRYQQSKIIILSDIGNGEQAAVEASRSATAWLVKPSLPVGSTGSDINDVHCELGIAEARRQIEAAIFESELDK
jgi:phage/plasmid primase-like uncharacterized protein